MTSPPFAESVFPTNKERSPMSPEEADPTPITIDPLGPDDAVPVLSKKDPLVPERAAPVNKSILPVLPPFETQPVLIEILPLFENAFPERILSHPLSPPEASASAVTIVSAPEDVLDPPEEMKTEPPIPLDEVVCPPWM
jgi:hypothetical protein